MSTANTAPKVEYREQKAKIRTFHEKKNSENVTVQIVMVKEERTGVMASIGPWSAWGVDNVAALESLKRMRGKSTDQIQLLRLRIDP